MMLFFVDLMGMLTGLSLATSDNLGATSYQMAVFVFALSSLFAGVLALPALPLSPSLSAVQVNSSSLLTLPYPRPPQPPVCPPTDRWGVTMGHPSYDDCEYILDRLYPKDQLAKPVMRNFYTSPADVSHTTSNFRLPYEQSYRMTAPHSLQGREGFPG